MSFQVLLSSRGGGRVIPPVSVGFLPPLLLLLEERGAFCTGVKSARADLVSKFESAGLESFSRLESDVVGFFSGFKTDEAGFFSRLSSAEVRLLKGFDSDGTEFLKGSGKVKLFKTFDSALSSGSFKKSLSKIPSDSLKDFASESDEEPELEIGQVIKELQSEKEGLCMVLASDRVEPLRVGGLQFLGNLIGSSDTV